MSLLSRAVAFLFICPFKGHVWSKGCQCQRCGDDVHVPAPNLARKKCECVHCFAECCSPKFTHTTREHYILQNSDVFHWYKCPRCGRESSERGVSSE